MSSTVKVSRLAIEGGEIKAKAIHGGAGILRTLKEAEGFLILPPKAEVRSSSRVEICLFNRLEALNLSEPPGYLKEFFT